MSDERIARLIERARNVTVLAGEIRNLEQTVVYGRDATISFDIKRSSALEDNLAKKAFEIGRVQLIDYLKKELEKLLSVEPLIVPVAEPEVEEPSRRIIAMQA